MGQRVFPADGGVYLCEYLKGNRPYTGGDMRVLPGTDVVGYGRIARFDAGFHKVAEFANETAESLTGFHGVTHSVLDPGGDFITYITDLGMRVLRFDVAEPAGRCRIW